MKKPVLFLTLVLLAGSIFALNYNNDYYNGLTEGFQFAFMSECKVYSLSVKGDYIFADIRKPGIPNSEKMFHIKKDETALYSLLLAAQLADRYIKVYFQYSHNQTPVVWWGQTAYHRLWSADIQ